LATEQQLIALAKEGSTAAFSELVAMYQESLLRFLLLRIGNRADAEDTVQETFMNAYRYIDSYKPRWKFSTWLYRIALRNAARISKSPGGGQGDVPDDAAGPLEACIESSDRENLWLTARRVLTADAYSAMWLRYVEDMSVKEVSRTLTRPATWTKVTLMRSRRRLREELAEEPDNAANGEAYG
jgi:RNA polymerase sigma-70 factor (ECF subfamily)